MTMTKFSRINKQREEITMRVLEDMEKGGNEWKKPWVEASPLPPHNPVSGTQYSGRNFLYTYVYGMMRGYADPRWATEKQIKEMGWKVPENLQNGRGGINDELGVGIEHWGIRLAALRAEASESHCSLLTTELISRIVKNIFFTSFKYSRVKLFLCLVYARCV